MITNNSTRLAGPSRARVRANSRATERANPPPPFPAAPGRDGYLGPGTVLAIDASENRAQVKWEDAGKSTVIWARLALAAPASLQPGATALVLTQDRRNAYIIGVLAERPAAAASPAAEAGREPQATVVRPAANETVRVLSRQGELVVEYDAASGKTIVNVEHGDLEFVAREGGIAFRGARKISLVAPRLETQADTVVAQAGNVYETVSELKQLQAGRTRTLVKGTCLLKARDAILNAEGDFAIDGKQIHLG